MSLVELLVVLAILGVLIALVLPAVQAAREASRRVMCVNNLRQIGFALSNYAAERGVFPQGMNGPQGYSLHTMILPELELASLYNSINLAFDSLGSTGWGGANYSSGSVSISVFLCPSDSTGVAALGPGRTNYAGNAGYGEYALGSIGIFVGDDLSPPYFGYADIRDGASQTAALSEWVVSPQGGSTLGYIYNTKDFREPAEYADFVRACANVDTLSPLFTSDKSCFWIQGMYKDTLMNFDQPINGHTCLNSNSVSAGSWTAESRHPGGANVVFMDGHARFFKESIDIRVWRAISTRAGAEIIRIDD